MIFNHGLLANFWNFNCNEIVLGITKKKKKKKKKKKTKIKKIIFFKYKFFKNYLLYKNLIK